MRGISWKTLTAGALVACSTLLASCYTDTGYSVGYVGGGYYNRSWGEPYWGWYGNYYYPGVGVYVYDVHHRRIPWTVEQQRYWAGRRGSWHGGPNTVHTNWRDFHGQGRPAPQHAPHDHHSNH
jgi:hypothetical protein